MVNWLKAETKKKIAIVAVACVSIVLNLYTLALAYPQTYVLNSGCCATQILAKDFSAYYTAAWRIVHDPANVYTSGLVNDGGPQILPHPQSFKYSPSFLIFIVPLTLFKYQDALTIFDYAQFLLLPLIVYFLYRLSHSKSLLTISLLVIVSVLQPSPTAHWGLSISYFWQWEEGQDKVLNLALLLASYYFALIRRPVLSGFTFALASFDPRFLILAVPLFLFYNKSCLRKAVTSFVILLLVLNSFLLIPGVWSGYFSMVMTSGLGTPLFYYGYIPLLTIVGLIIVNCREMYGFFRSMLPARASRIPSVKMSEN